MILKETIFLYLILDKYLISIHYLNIIEIILTLYWNSFSKKKTLRQVSILEASPPSAKLWSAPARSSPLRTS